MSHHYECENMLTHSACWRSGIRGSDSYSNLGLLTSNSLLHLLHHSHLCSQASRKWSRQQAEQNSRQRGFSQKPLFHSVDRPITWCLQNAHRLQGIWEALASSFSWYSPLQIESYSDEMIEGHLRPDPLTLILLKWNYEVTAHLRNFRQSNGVGPINQRGMCLPLSASGSLRTTLSAFGPQKNLHDL